MNCGGWEEPCGKPATRIFEARPLVTIYGETKVAGEWRTVRLCEHHWQAYAEKNTKENFAEFRSPRSHNDPMARLDDALENLADALVPFGEDEGEYEGRINGRKIVISWKVE
jgi:hypothetical protein